jgi:hypothetical protein
LEDLIQSVALEHFESKGKQNWLWACCNYTRKNGLGTNDKLKSGARAIECSLSIDAPGRSKDRANSEYLLNQESISRSEHEARNNSLNDNFNGVLEEFLSPLNINNEAMKWVLKSYKVKTKLR